MTLCFWAWHHNSFVAFLFQNAGPFVQTLLQSSFHVLGENKIGCWRAHLTPQRQQYPCGTLDQKSCSHHSTHLKLREISHEGAERKPILLIESGFHFTDRVIYFAGSAFLGTRVVKLLAQDTLLGNSRSAESNPPVLSLALLADSVHVENVE